MLRISWLWHIRLMDIHNPFGIDNKKIPEKRHVMPPFRDLCPYFNCFYPILISLLVRPYFLSHKSDIGAAERDEHQRCQAGQMRPYEQEALSKA